MPPIRLIAFDQEVRGATLINTPADLRSLRVEEFLTARSLSPNSQRAYRHELERFMAWTDRAWGEISPRQIAQFKEHLQDLELSSTSVNRALAPR